MMAAAAIAADSVYSAVARTSLAVGSGTFFGLMGEDTALSTAALVEKGGRHVAARHEAGAVGLADGYASATASSVSVWSLVARDC